VPFLVQIRDLDTHKYMPGVECGDMGPKLGYHSKDNGWLIMKNVRIPRN
jgi:acyl-CoA oxidase